MKRPSIRRLARIASKLSSSAPFGAKSETRNDNKVHAEIILASGMIELGRVKAGEELTAPLEIDIDPAAPISIGSTTTFVRTRLNVAGAVDPTDKDPVRLLPTPAMLAVINSLEQPNRGRITVCAMRPRSASRAA